jgi:magnesium transporter
MRILTVFAAIVLPLTFVTSIFSMNVDFPGFGTAWGFWIVVASLAVTLVGLLAFFRYKNWL